MGSKIANVRSYFECNRFRDDHINKKSHHDRDRTAMIT